MTSPPVPFVTEYPMNKVFTFALLRTYTHTYVRGVTLDINTRLLLSHWPDGTKMWRCAAIIVG